MIRFFDILIASLVLISSLPLMIIASIMVWMDSPGPILFCARRIGCDNSEFSMYKFRTMYVEAPPNVATDKLADTNQFITPCGRFLRKTSIDELPQFLNVLLGNMTVVGPRPAATSQLTLISLRTQYGISIYKPGITGFAQISGRDRLSENEKVELEKQYLSGLGLGAYFLIIFRTVLYVLWMKDIRH